MGLSHEHSCETGSFSRLNPHRCFQSEVLRLFPHARTVGCGVCLTPQLFLPVYLHSNVGLPSLKSTALPGPPATTVQASPLHTAARLHPSYRLNVSSLSPWLSNFYTVRFSVSSGCFLFLNCCCCPSFGCARSRSVSTYASILART